MMKTFLLILLSGAFFAVAQTQNNQINGTEKESCPVNETPTTCEPCESFCNERPTACILICRVGNYCTCVSGYTRISRTNRECVPEKSCSQYAKPNCTTKNPTIEPPEKIY